MQEGQADHVLQARQAGRDLRGLGAAVEFPAAVAVPVGADQHLGADLAKPVEDAAPAEVGRAAGPDRSDAGRREHGDHRLRDVRQVGGNPVAGPDTHVAQPGGQDAHLAGEDRPGQPLQGDGFAGEQQRVPAGPLALPGPGAPLVPQDVLGVVEPGAREPLGAGHGAAAEHRGGRRGRPDAAVVPDGLPEAVQIGDRPPPQGVVAGEFVAAGLAEPAGEAGDVRAGHLRGAGVHSRSPSRTLTSGGSRSGP
jgi:hypothetical protein